MLRANKFRYCIDDVVYSVFFCFCSLLKKVKMRLFRLWQSVLAVQVGMLMRYYLPRTIPESPTPSFVAHISTFLPSYEKVRKSFQI
jgi:hypothetical protein